MLYALALIPVAGLLAFIYFNDKKEKEPFGFLISLFFLGMATVVSAIILELVGGLILESAMPNESVLKGWIDAMIIVAPAEELGKFLILRLRTWKSKHFDYSYDAIVYSVFVSLGFAALENVSYVFQSGIGTALLRMFTAVPGHACFAVFMGFFYGKAKYAQITNKKGRYALFTLLSIFMPILLHGIYDAIIMGGSASDEILISGLSIVVWIGYVITLFAGSVVIIIFSSKHDYCIVSLPDEVQTVYHPAIVGGWLCNCGTRNFLKFCPTCGTQRPYNSQWTCTNCGNLSTFNFCGVCGKPNPYAPPKAQQ